jgi:hypothetical protein
MTPTYAAIIETLVRSLERPLRRTRIGFTGGYDDENRGSYLMGLAVQSKADDADCDCAPGTGQHSGSCAAVDPVVTGMVVYADGRWMPPDRARKEDVRELAGFVGRAP